ncbi:MAG: stage II sporulation protein M [Bacteroidales bacterium]
MRESQFIDQNKEKWHEFEKILRDKQEDPEKISTLFVQVTEDLSYARTFYPNRSVRQYLNLLSRKVFLKVYRYRAFRWSRFWQFWTDELPFVVHASRRQMLLALVVFTLTMVLGVMSSAYDPGFTGLVLGSDYIEMTMRNIEQGDPMAVYKSQDGGTMFFGITWNNVRVAFLTFIMGIFFGIGSIYILIVNALMLGAFQYFFLERGLLPEAMLTIWQHGTLEIASIIIAGGAGITLGHGLVFPGTYTRMEAFRITAYRGMKLLLGTVPLFIMAGFIEGFVTRQTEAPMLLRIMVIVASSAFILFYFVWLPFRKHSTDTFRKFPPEKVSPSVPFRLRTGILTNATIIRDSFAFLKDNAGRFIRIGFPASLIILGLYLWLYRDFFYPEFSLGDMSSFAPGAPVFYIADVYNLFLYEDYPAVFPLAVILFTLVVHIAMVRLAKTAGIPLRRPGLKFLFTMLVVFLAHLSFLLVGWIVLINFILMIFLSPVFFSLIAAAYFPSGALGFRGTLGRLLGSFYFRILFLILITAMISFSMMVIFSTPLLYLYAEFGIQHIAVFNVGENLPYLVYLIITGITSLSILFPFIAVAVVLKKRSLDEKVDAGSLITFFAQIGKQRRAYGFRRED